MGGRRIAALIPLSSGIQLIHPAKLPRLAFSLSVSDESGRPTDEGAVEEQGAREPRRLAMDAAASVLLLEPDGNLHNNGTNKRTLKAFLGVLVYCWTGFRKDVLVRHSQM